MKTIRIRKFMILSLVLLFLLPWVFLVAAHYIETNTFRLGMTDRTREEMDKTIRLIEANSISWTDQAWQDDLLHQLQKQNMEAAIYTETNEVIFQSSALEDRTFSQAEQFSIIEDGSLYRVVISYSDSSAIQMVAALIGVILAFFIIGIAMKRMIIKPLEQLSSHAQTLAKGNFDVQLASSKISEIDEVRDGFNVMVTGLKAAFQKQEEMEKERRFVISAVAHDLRTPLFALRGYLDGLEQGIARSPEKMAKYVAVCKEKSAQLDRLVEDLFTFTKVEYIKVYLNKQHIDFSWIIKQAFNSVRVQSEQKMITLIDKTETNCMISGDPHLLERAMINVLDNAIRHTPINGKIVVQCYKKNDKVMFTVQDTGKGFSLEELRHVFEPLYRGETSRNRSTGGAGLGLTISQKIMKQHGGDLTATNHNDGGALLTGWLP